MTQESPYPPVEQVKEILEHLREARLQLALAWGSSPAFSVYEDVCADLHEAVSKAVEQLENI